MCQQPLKYTEVRYRILFPICCKLKENGKEKKHNIISVADTIILLKYSVSVECEWMTQLFYWSILFL
jgi:hypothetical protein